MGFYEQNPTGVILAVMAFGIQAALIGILINERRVRKESQQLLDERLRAETLLADISSAFANLPDERADARISYSLERIGKFMGVDRSTLWKLDGNNRFQRGYFWKSQTGIQPLEMQDESMPYVCGQLRQGKDAIIPSLADLPASSTDRESLARAGARAVLAIPLILGDRLVGALTMTRDTKDQNWNDSQVKATRTFAELLTSAMDRKRTHDAVRESEALNEAMLSSLPGYIVVLDNQGFVLQAGDRGLAGELPDGLQPDIPGTRYAENWKLAGSGEQAERTAPFGLPGYLRAGRKTDCRVSLLRHRRRPLARNSYPASAA